MTCISCISSWWWTASCSTTARIIIISWKIPSWARIIASIIATFFTITWIGRAIISASTTASVITSVLTTRAKLDKNYSRNELHSIHAISLDFDFFDLYSWLDLGFSSFIIISITLLFHIFGITFLLSGFIRLYTLFMISLHFLILLSQ